MGTISFHLNQSYLTRTLMTVGGGGSISSSRVELPVK